MSTIESHAGLEGAPRRKAYRWRDPEFREPYIDRMARVILTWFPELADDVEKLVSPPPVDKWSVINGHGLYGGDQALIYRGIIANDLRATPKEMADALERARAAQAEGDGGSSASVATTG